MSDSSETKVCPYCAETIKAAAKVCPFCQSRLYRGFIKYDLPIIVSVLAIIALVCVMASLFETRAPFRPLADFAGHRSELEVKQLHLDQKLREAESSLIGIEKKVAELPEKFADDPQVRARVREFSDRTNGVEAEYQLTGVVTNSGAHAWRVEKMEVRFLDSGGRLSDVYHKDVSSFLVLPGQEHAFALKFFSNWTNSVARTEVYVQVATEGNRPEMDTRE